MDEAARSERSSVALDQALVTEARERGLDPARIAERAVRRAVEASRGPKEIERLAAEFRRDNAAALERDRKRIAEHGPFLGDLAVLRFESDRE